MTAFACVLLVACILGYVFYPEKRVTAQVQKGRLEFLKERKEVLYENLRDLNFEFRAGKYAPEDYEAQRAAMENEAAAILAEIDTYELPARRT